MDDPFSDYAVMVVCAADVDQIWHIATNDGQHEQNNPTLPAEAEINALQIGYVHDGNFAAVGQIRCDDSYISKANNVYFGLVLEARRRVGPMAPGDLLVAIRGTLDPMDWIANAASIILIPAGAAGKVGAGFIIDYQSMRFGSLNGAMEGGAAAGRIALLAQATPAANVFVCGHSLGAVLATFLAYDLNKALGPADAKRVQPFLFASPRTGDQDWVNAYQQAVFQYDLCNYAPDLVPLLPPDGASLNPGGPWHNVHIIPAGAPGALDTGFLADLDAVANHSPIGYARMLDPTNAIAQRLKP